MQINIDGRSVTRVLAVAAATIGVGAAAFFGGQTTRMDDTAIAGVKHRAVESAVDKIERTHAAELAIFRREAKETRLARFARRAASPARTSVSVQPGSPTRRAMKVTAAATPLATARVTLPVGKKAKSRVTQMATMTPWSTRSLAPMIRKSTFHTAGPTAVTSRWRQHGCLPVLRDCSRSGTHAAVMVSMRASDAARGRPTAQSARQGAASRAEDA